MAGKMSQNKGKRGEREIINALQPILDRVYSEAGISDVPLLQRNTLQSDKGGFDVVGLDWMAIEVKFQESLSIATWWKQTTGQAKAGQTPILFYRKSRVKWRVMLPMNIDLNHGGDFFYCPADISFDDFLEFFELRVKGDIVAIS